MDEVQASLDALAAALVPPTQASDLVAKASALNLQAFKLSAAIEQLPSATKTDPRLLQRLRQMALILASCQEHLARHAVLTDQALRMLFPAARSATYDSVAPGRPGQLYGSPGRQSGEFRAVSA